MAAETTYDNQALALVIAGGDAVVGVTLRVQVEDAVIVGAARVVAARGIQIFAGEYGAH
jgi:hypothetical protein